MSDIAIKVEDLSKMYRLGNIGTGSLGTDITSWWAGVRGKEDPFSKIAIANDRSQKATSDFVWSLKNINFEIKQGEAVSIIGKNGAGKSTLLKILSRVTSPTTGNVKVNGRIASLLEVGTGFHGDLTGRENIFMNGSILGMPRKNIALKIQDIIDFSGIEGYIDTPVKRYSSGMYVRLAFAVAAFLDPDIMIIDEVLAVGDSAFQQKCISKIASMSDQNKTILFVSHNIPSIKALCSRAILLENGGLAMDGPVGDVIERYSNIVSSDEIMKDCDLLSVYRDGHEQAIIFEYIKFKNNPIKFGQTIELELGFKRNVQKTFKDIDIGVSISDKNRNTIIHVSNRFSGQLFTHETDSVKYQVTIDNEIRPGIYSLNLFLRCEDRIQDWLRHVISLEVLDGNQYNYSNTNLIQGVVLPKFNFSSLIK